MKKTKLDKGITLVALIITIVLLLILAVVTIRAVQGEGILIYAKKSASAYNSSQIKEEIKILEYEDQILRETEEESELLSKIQEKEWCKNIVRNTHGEIVITTINGETISISDPNPLEKLEIGSFIEYNVAYTDAYFSDYTYNATNGWRLFDYTDNGDGTYSNVKLISTGIPANLYYLYNDIDNPTENNLWYVTDEELLADFRIKLETDSQNTFGRNFGFYPGSGRYYALEASAGLYYNFEDIKFAYSEIPRGANLGFFTSITSNGIVYDNSNTVEKTGKDLFNLIGDNAKVRLLTIGEHESRVKNTIGLCRLNSLNNVKGMENRLYTNIRYWLASPFETDSTDGWAGTSIYWLNEHGPYSHSRGYWARSSSCCLLKF